MPSAQITDKTPCPTCRRFRKDLVAAYGLDVPNGDLAIHLRLCLGFVQLPGQSGVTYLGFLNQCPDTNCSQETFPTHRSMAQHLQRSHNMGASVPLNDILAKFHADIFPTRDVNTHYGQLWTREGMRPRFRTMLDEALLDPTRALTKLPERLKSYRMDFLEFTGAVPITFGMHVSHQLTAESFAHVWRGLLNAWGSNEFWFSRRNKSDWTCSQLAMVDGMYGTFQGPTTMLPTNIQVSSGVRPIIINLRDPIEQQVLKARDRGCRAVVVEMVCSKDGRPISPTAWQVLYQACEKYSMLLVVDEAMTAVRSGYPFAHQHPDYKQYLPSLVVFGKGFQTAGVAVYRNGCCMADQMNLPREDPDWLDGLYEHFDSRMTCPIPPISLVSAHDALRKAMDDSFCDRAQRIGHTLRSYIENLPGDMKPSERHSGMHALIFLPMSISASSGLVPASSGKLVRWLPFLDVGMDSPRMISALFGTSAGHSREVLEKMVSGACATCGERFRPNEHAVLCSSCNSFFCAECTKKPTFESHKQGRCLSDARSIAKVDRRGDSDDNSDSVMGIGSRRTSVSTSASIGVSLNPSASASVNVSRNSSMDRIPRTSRRRMTRPGSRSSMDADEQPSGFQADIGGRTQSRGRARSGGNTETRAGPSQMQRSRAGDDNGSDTMVRQSSMNEKPPTLGKRRRSDQG